MAMNDYGIDQYGKPRGMDQTSPFTDKPQTQAAPQQQQNPPGLQQSQGSGQTCPGNKPQCPNGQQAVCNQTNGGYQWSCGGGQQQAQTNSVQSFLTAPVQAPLGFMAAPQMMNDPNPGDPGTQPTPPPEPRPGHPTPPDPNAPIPTPPPAAPVVPPVAPTTSSRIPMSWNEQWFTSNFGRPNTMDELLALKDRIEAAGGKVNQNASGRWNGKITDPNGQIIDIIHAAGLGGDGFQWLTGGGYGGELTDSFDMGSMRGPTGAPSLPAPSPYTPTMPLGPISYTPPSTRIPLETLIQQMLSTTSLSPEIVAQMKESQKGTILEGADQLRQQTLQDSAGRGTAAGGTTQGLLSRIGSESLGDISGAYRDIDINKAIQDRTDQERAAGIGLSFEEQLLSEFLGLSRENTERYSIDNQIGLASNDQAFENWLREQGLLLDWFNTNESTRRHDLGHQLTLAEFLAG